MKILNQSYNMQGIFDTCVEHLRKQGAKSGIEVTDSVGVKKFSCMYLAPDGKKCAAGIFIPKKLYKEDFESNRIYYILRFITKDVSSEEAELLSALQYVHDDSPIDRWESKFKELAVRFNLTYSLFNRGMSNANLG